MFKKILITSIGVGIFAWSCKSKKEIPTNLPNENNQFLNKTEPKQYKVINPMDSLNKYDWYLKGFGLHTNSYKQVQPNLSLIKNHPNLSKLSITVVGGTWCEDTQRELPTLISILEKVDFDLQNKLELIWVDRDKKAPDGRENELKITNIPIFIFKIDGVESYRMVETAVPNVQEEILKGLR
jgi:thiol-disulfide isomerase/thioredoxin